MARGETREIQWRRIGNPQAPGKYAYGAGSIDIVQADIDIAKKHGPGVSLTINECSDATSHAESWVILKMGPELV